MLLKHGADSENSFEVFGANECFNDMFVNVFQIDKIRIIFKDNVYATCTVKTTLEKKCNVRDFLGKSLLYLHNG